jgi:hypothetical protein
MMEEWKRKSGRMECWNIEMMEEKDGIIENWNEGKKMGQKIELLEDWNNGKGKG